MVQSLVQRRTSRDGHPGAVNRTMLAGGHGDETRVFRPYSSSADVVCSSDFMIQFHCAVSLVLCKPCYCRFWRTGGSRLLGTRDIQAFSVEADAELNTEVLAKNGEYFHYNVKHSGHVNRCTVLCPFAVEPS